VEAKNAWSLAQHLKSVILLQKQSFVRGMILLISSDKQNCFTISAIAGGSLVLRLGLTKFLSWPLISWKFKPCNLRL
jgi:hypothetical protein